MNLVDECYQQALQVLKGNSTEFGFKASRERYNAIWGRDSSITCLGACLTGNEQLMETCQKTLATLQSLQTPLGQIPNVFHLDTKKTNFYATDATLWWVIALAGLWRQTGDKGLLVSSWSGVKKAITWLQYQVIDTSQLINSPPAADWMDSSIQRWGKVLYSNVLYYQALKAANELAGVVGESNFDDPDAIKHGTNLLFWPEEPVADEWLTGWFTQFYEEVIDKDREHYLTYLSFEGYGGRCDTLANCLSILWEIAGEDRKRRILAYIAGRRLSQPYPIRVLDPPIFQPDLTWNPRIDIYRPQHWQNLPFCYHNAGIWPWVGGFYIATLVKAGEYDLAEKELKNLAVANWVGRDNEWEFNEWLHGKSGKPMGAAFQAWSASGYIIAYKAVTQRILP